MDPGIAPPPPDASAPRPGPGALAPRRLPTAPPPAAPAPRPATAATATTSADATPADAARSGHAHRHDHPGRPDGVHARGRDRWARIGGLAVAAGVTAYVGLVDPATGGAYPLCPSRFLLGVDCPACGGLRGTHDLLHGDVVSALDHNLLLPLWLGLFAVMLAVWAAPLVGRAVPAVRPPRWLVAAGIAVAGAFAVLRNLPIDGLEFLASGA